VFITEFLCFILYFCTEVTLSLWLSPQIHQRLSFQRFGSYQPYFKGRLYRFI